ncbi:hypothetical protein AQUCO_03000281v1 [Aquilegia coerulea]|uniref:FBD domain-containing protein n=1 Tax=Aquilegia coerulea TaxID=218851 RepID=A0A2G5D280_AQUCA|nr:hypothetical protein AQUCO_03000281v1 [Aquilegia coerulea]
MPTTNYVKVITFLLRIYPNLQTLYLSVYQPENYDQDLASSSMINMEGYWQGDELCSGVNLKHLRTVEIVEFGGTDIELDILRRLFESASILEKMNIRYSSFVKQNAEKLTTIHEKMSLFYKVSSSATISLAYHDR